MIPITFCNFSKKPNSTARPYIGPTTFTITASQEGEGDPSPSNPRPILPGLSFRLDNNQMLDVYGGIINFISGVLTVTHKKKTLSELEWVYQPEQYRFYSLSIQDEIFYPATIYVASDSYCDKLKVVARNDLAEKTICVSTGGQVFIRDTDYTTTEALIQNLGSAEFVYPLATPQTMTLSQSELSRAAAALGIPWPIHLPSMYQADNCELIEDTSIITPKIRWHEHDLYSPYDFNYCYIPAFERYYFVTNITYQLGTWLIDLSVDVLATAKSIIGSSTQYILRSAYEWDGDIVDSMYPTMTDPLEITVNAEADPNGSAAPLTIYGDAPTPCYVVGLIGAVAASNIPVVDDATKLIYNGTVCYYLCKLSQLRQLIDKLMDVNEFLLTYNIPTSELSESLQKQLINPLQYIHSIKAMPCTPDTVLSSIQNGFMMGFNAYELKYSDPQDTPYLGKWSIICNKNPGTSYLPAPSNGAQGYVQTFRCEVRAPIHPQYYTDRANCHYIVGAPFSKYTVYVEPFGMIELPSGNMLASKIEFYHDPEDPGADYYYINLKFDCTVDFSTGDARLRIWSTPASTTGEVVHYIGTQHIAIDVPFHQTMQDAFTYRDAMRNLNAMNATEPLSLLKSAVGFFGGMQAGTTMSQSVGTQQGIQGVSGVVGSIKNAKNAIDSAEAAAQVGITTGNTSIGSWMSYFRDLSSPKVHAYFYPIVPELRADLGRPLCAPRQISNVPGYNLCANGHISSGLTAQENQMIEDFLNGGFYYE